MRRLLAILVCSFGVIQAQPAQVMIIRHAEKDAKGNLSQKGLERAGALATYFAKEPSLLVYGLPSALFAARPTENTFPFQPDDNTARCLQTLGPTAQAFTLPIHPGFAKFEESALAEFVLNNFRYDNQNVLICWQLETIPALAEAFGVQNPPVYPSNQFDQTWVITFSPNAQLVVQQQKLMFGDQP